MLARQPQEVRERPSHPMHPEREDDRLGPLGAFPAPPPIMDERGFLTDYGKASMQKWLEVVEAQEHAEKEEADKDLNLGPLLPAGMQLEEAAALREAYRRGAQAIADEAAVMLRAGADEKMVADWAVKARNALKQQIRDQGARIIKALAEARNIRKYGNPLGPTAEELRAAGKSNQQIIEGVTRSNPKVNRWTGRLRVAGRILIVLDIGIGIWNVASAPAVDRPRVLLRETGRLAGGVGGAWGGAKLGGAAGSFFGPIGTGVGAVLGGIVGAFIGSKAGSALGDFAADQFYPPEQTAFEGQYVE